jgi:hypothetical protein
VASQDDVVARLGSAHQVGQSSFGVSYGNAHVISHVDGLFDWNIRPSNGLDGKELKDGRITNITVRLASFNLQVNLLISTKNIWMTS